MMNLVLNENMKLRKSASTWIMMGILVLIIGIAGLIFKFGIGGTASGDWKEDLEASNQEMKASMSQEGIPKSVVETLQVEIDKNNYRIDNDIPPIKDNSIWGFVSGATGSLVSIIALFAIIMGGRIVANEFSNGTIKLLLIRPVKRWKVLVSKYISLLLYTLLMLLVLFVVSFLFGGILFGFKGVDTPFLEMTGGVIREVSMTLHLFKVIALSCVNLIMMVTLAFMISTVSRNSGLAIGIGVFLLMIGNVITMVLSQFEWSKFILFANVDLNQHINGTPIVEGMTMTFSVIVLIVYFVIFNAISYLGFTKRDITL